MPAELPACSIVNEKREIVYENKGFTLIALLVVIAGVADGSDSLWGRIPDATMNTEPPAGNDGFVRLNSMTRMAVRLCSLR